jgi:hypothetical protein
MKVFFKRFTCFLLRGLIAFTALFCATHKPCFGLPKSVNIIDAPFAQFIHVYDWDETVMFMPNQVKLFKKGSNEFLVISPIDFAHYRTEIGTGIGPFANYEYRFNIPGGSFDEFQLTGPDSLFKKTIEKAIKLPESEWQGPAFWNWVKDLLTPDGAKRVYTLSARAHLPNEWHDGFLVLQKFLLERHNIKIYLPPPEHSKGVGSSNKVAEDKAAWIKQLIENHADQLKGLIYFEDDLTNTQRARRLFQELESTQNIFFNAQVAFVGKRISCEDLLGLELTRSIFKLN